MEFVGKGIATFGIWMSFAIMLVFLRPSPKRVKELNLSLWMDLLHTVAQVVATAMIWL